MTVRQSILTDIETVLDAIAEIQTVEVGKIDPVDLENLNLPAVFVFSGPEQKAAGSTEHETWDWTVVIEVWCKDTEAETLQGLIHTAMAVDISRGGVALNCFRESGEAGSLDPNRSLAVVQLIYKILYRHPMGTP